MAMTRKEFEEIADSIATARKVNTIGNGLLYLESRLLMMCEEHGHNFNKKIFLERIAERENELNDEE